jgi:hypothetical protein
MEKKDVKRAWLKFWKDKVDYTDVEPVLGMNVLAPEQELRFWEDFEKYLDNEIKK